MLTERSELENGLYFIIEKYNKDKKAKEQVTKEMSGKGILAGDTIAILNKVMQINNLSGEKLYLLSKSLFNTTKENIINPEKYFTELEIERAEKYEEKNKKIEKFPLIFDKVTEISNDHFKVILTIQQIVELYNRLVVVYNYETQRESIKKEIDGLIFEKPDVNEESVEDIKNALLKNQFIPTDDITFNLLYDRDDEYKFDERSGMLKITKGKFNIVDGYHRCLGMIRALIENPNLDYKFGVNITNFDTDKAKRVIIQSDKKNKINGDYLDRINPDKLENDIIKRINESSSDVRGMITTNDLLIKSGKALIDWDILSLAIKENFKNKYKMKREVMDVADWLIECFNELVYLNPIAFKDNIVKIRKESIINHPNTFIGYMAIFSKLQGDLQWSSKN